MSRTRCCKALGRLLSVLLAVAMLVPLPMVLVPDVQAITQAEIDMILAKEAAAYESRGKRLGELNLELAGDEIVVHSSPVSDITRVRRITGYLSNQNNFNDAKRSELRDRAKHCSCS